MGVFRWVWFCGYDAQCDCTPSNAQWMFNSGVTTGATCPADSYVGYGLGEIFVNCTYIRKVNSNGSPFDAEAYHCCHDSGPRNHGGAPSLLRLIVPGCVRWIFFFSLVYY